ncbi:hypothetical protein FACS189450_06250 [Spirochaetia bacterium]|nr:hypothetical protein FACS189450_06250 [Spirochaetia bacterium]
MLFNAKEIGKKLSCRFLQTPHLFYPGINEPLHYAEVLTWHGALRFASLTGDKELAAKLTSRFELLFNEEKTHLPEKNHVDFNMFGCLPLEFYQLTGDERYKNLGMPYADAQWELPGNATEEHKQLLSKGYSWQTRLWMDDMYMITIVQSQAYKVTGDRKYIDRAAHEMVLYLDELQRPNGLFFHAPDAPFYWGRANGWMAAGMAELLKHLPEDNANRGRILKGYVLMMESLKKYQGTDGMWKQLIDAPDCWNETSGTAMFAYAMLAGINKGWLSAGEYTQVTQKAWAGLLSYIDEKGDVKEVCTGTPKSDKKEFYYDRPRVTGDYHGQAPVLWCVIEGVLGVKV